MSRSERGLTCIRPKFLNGGLRTVRGPPQRGLGRPSAPWRSGARPTGAPVRPPFDATSRDGCPSPRLEARGLREGGCLLRPEGALREFLGAELWKPYDGKLSRTDLKGGKLARAYLSTHTAPCKPPPGCIGCVICPMSISERHLGSRRGAQAWINDGRNSDGPKVA